MLTKDDKKQILELRTRGYSHRKIATITDHSENTVRDVIKEAEEQVIRLAATRLEADQIASQLDYPLVFVSLILRKHEDEKKEEAKGESKAEETSEEIESIPQKIDVKTDWSEFQREQEIEQRKEQIKSEAIESINNLKQMESDYKKEEVFDVAYDRRRKAIKKELEDFVLAIVDQIDSIEAISNLERISEEIEEKIMTLFDDYDKKVGESMKLRKNRENKHSEKLLGEEINRPMIPDFVRNFIKSNFLVKNREEALIVLHALFEWVIFHDMLNKSDKESEKLWRAFIGIAKEGKGDYLIKLASKFNKRPLPA